MVFAINKKSVRKEPFLENEAEDTDTRIDRRVSLEEKRVAYGEDVVEAEIALELGGRIHEANNRDSCMKTRVIDLLKLHFFQNRDNRICDLGNHIVCDRRIHKA